MKLLTGTFIEVLVIADKDVRQDLVAKGGKFRGFAKLSGMLHLVAHVDLAILLAIGLEYASEGVI